MEKNKTKLYLIQGIQIFPIHIAQATFQVLSSPVHLVTSIWQCADQGVGEGLIMICYVVRLTARKDLK